MEAVLLTSIDAGACYTKVAVIASEAKQSRWVERNRVEIASRSLSSGRPLAGPVGSQ